MSVQVRVTKSDSIASLVFFIVVPFVVGDRSIQHAKSQRARSRLVTRRTAGSDDVPR
jgi:hypothetical protein